MDHIDSYIYIFDLYRHKSMFIQVAHFPDVPHVARVVGVPYIPHVSHIV